MRSGVVRKQRGQGNTKTDAKEKVNHSMEVVSIKSSTTLEVLSYWHVIQSLYSLHGTLH